MGGAYLHPRLMHLVEHEQRPVSAAVRPDHIGRPIQEVVLHHDACLKRHDHVALDFPSPHAVVELRYLHRLLPRLLDQLCHTAVVWLELVLRRGRGHPVPIFVFLRLAHTWSPLRLPVSPRFSRRTLADSRAQPQAAEKSCQPGWPSAPPPPGDFPSGLCTSAHSPRLAAPNGSGSACVPAEKPAARSIPHVPVWRRPRSTRAGVYPGPKRRFGD